MNNNLTELVFILDKSGSMEPLTDDTIGGFNSMLEKQKEAEGEALVSCVLFSDESTVVYDRTDLGKIERMTKQQYRPGGCTALIDALGGSIHHIANVHKYIREEDRPAHTLFVVITDGLENASHRYTSDEVKKMISEKQEKGWEFLFLGANIDAVETAKTYGISEGHAVRYKSDGVGTKKVFAGVAEAACMLRSNKHIMNAWKEEIEEDVKERGV